MNTQTPFTTYDIYLAAVLVAFDFPLERIEKTLSGKSLFYFNSSPVLDSTIQKYWKQELRVSPQVLFNSLKFIKNRLYSSY